MSQRDNAVLALALDEYAPSEAVQKDILRRVLRAVNTDDGQTDSGGGSSAGTDSSCA